MAPLIWSKGSTVNLNDATYVLNSVGQALFEEGVVKIKSGDWLPTFTVTAQVESGTPGVSYPGQPIQGVECSAEIKPGTEINQSFIQMQSNLPYTTDEKGVCPVTLAFTNNGKEVAECEVILFDGSQYRPFTLMVEPA